MMRSRRGRFLPGISPNPGGRPKVMLVVIDTARAHTLLAIKTLAEVAANPHEPAAARIAAAVALLDRGWGKPRQPVNAEMDMHAVLVAALNAARDRVRGRSPD